MLRDQDRHALPRQPRGEAERHAEGAADLILEGLSQLVERHVQLRRLELEPHEVDARILLRRVLVEVGDVGAVAEEERGDGRHDARPVGALDEEDGLALGTHGAAR